jgi:hypothetical protein
MLVPANGGEGESFLFNLWIQMPISSANTPTDASQSNALPTVWTSLNSVQLIHKISTVWFEINVGLEGKRIG